MPTVLRHEAFRFFFYSSDKPEPPHVHVERDNGTAKIWIDPVRLQDSQGFSRTDISKILKIAENNRILMLRSWNEYFHHEK